MRLSLLLLLTFCANVQGGGLLGKYYGTKDCTGPYDWRIDEKISFSSDEWAHGPRGQVQNFCIEWTGQLQQSGCNLWAEADDGVYVAIKQGGKWKPVINRFNGFDHRPCNNRDGDCTAPSGEIKIVYYQATGDAYMRLYCADKTGRSKKLLESNAFSPASPPANDPLATEIITLTKDSDCCYKSLSASCDDAKECKKTLLQPITYARLGEVTTLYRSTYWSGKGDPSTSFFYAQACTNFLFLGATAPGMSVETSNSNAVPNDDNVVLQVEMGDNVDYYKPLPGHNFCDMVMNNRHHLWSKTGEPFTFIQPSYVDHNTLLGGSDANWPLYNVAGDRRKYLSFWGGNGNNGGCCHYKKNGIRTNGKDEPSAWNKEATLKVLAMKPNLVAPTLSETVSAEWTPLGWVAGSWNTELQTQRDGTFKGTFPRMASRGLRDSYAGLNSGAYYLRKCDALKGDLQNVYILMCMSTEQDFTIPNDSDLNKDNRGTQCDVFRPSRDSTSVCSMLTSKTEHLWCAELESVSPQVKCKHWVKPKPHSKDYAGGSASPFPQQYCVRGCRAYDKEEHCNDNDDCVWFKSEKACKALDSNRATLEASDSVQLCNESRSHVPFWGGYRGGYGRLSVGGETKAWLAPGREDWHRDYRMWIMKAEKLANPPTKPTEAEMKKAAEDAAKAKDAAKQKK